MKKILPAILLLITILTPILLITTGMRVALSPLFVSVEYRLPGFPADDYGFTTAERLKWANYSIKYLLGRYTDNEFSNLHFPDGSPLFNEREISHMVDVRDLTIIVLFIWRFLILFFSAFLLLSWKQKWLYAMAGAAGKGARITLLFILGILLYLVINFNQLFTQFHRIFFEGDSWLFYYSDTLIRLFPIKFWQDLFIFIGGFGILISLALLLVENTLKKQRTA